MTTARGPRYKQIPLWRDANHFLLEVERAVRQFPRYHKYTLGSELRQQSMNVCRLVARAAQAGDPIDREALLKQLVWQVEDIKMSLQLAKELEALTSFARSPVPRPYATGASPSVRWSRTAICGAG